MPDGGRPNPPVLSVRALSVTFTGSGRDVPAVRAIDFDVHAGEVLGIVGESGSGKSVTALAITGLLPPTARVTGSIRMGDTEITTASQETLRTLRGRAVGMIFQDPTTTLNPVLPIGRQVIEGQIAHGLAPAAEAAPRAAALLREVDIPDPETRITQYPHQFSGGMRQRAVIAMAMAGAKRLIIADEPTTALDVTVQAQVLAVLAKRQAETGAAVILITHDLGVIAEFADRVAVMYGGRIVETGNVGEIFRAPRHPYTVGLLHSLPRLDIVADRLVPIPGQPPAPARLPPGCAFHPRCPIVRARCRAEDPPLHELSPHESALGRATACHFPDEVQGLLTETTPHKVAPTAAAPIPASDTPLLEVENLKIHFPIRTGLLRRQTGTIRAVDGVSLTLRPGETLGLVGESGCGKTTTGRAIMGLIRATAGSIRFGSEEVTTMGPAALRRTRRNMQYIFQDPYASLNPIKTAGDIVAEPLHIHRLFDAFGGTKHIEDLFERVGLSRTMLGRYPSEFSGGQKQRIGIARALALSPKLLILDEPVAALDVSIQAQVVNLLQDLQKQLGLAYLFIAHDLSVVRHICDRVAVMYLGRIVEQSTKHTLYAAPTHPYTQSLLSAVPIPDPARRGPGGKAGAGRIILQGDIPSPARPPSGCTFHPRCFRAETRCATEAPTFRDYPGLPTSVACHFAGPRSGAVS